jgi:DNA-binding transcriptional MerR regulator
VTQRAKRRSGRARNGDAPTANELTIERLAQHTGLSVRNIRSHHARGLLPPPEVRRRVGYYGDLHIARINLIKELQDEGLKLEGIKRLLDESHSTSEGLLRVKEAADATAEVEQPEILNGAELAERLGLGEKDAVKALAKAEKLGILVPLGEGLYETPMPSLLDAAEEARRTGIDVSNALDAAGELERHARSVSRRFIKLFLDDVWKPFADAGMPEDEWPRIAEAMERTRPLAAHALLGVFRQTMSREVDATFADIAKRLSQGKQ